MRQQPDTIDLLFPSERLRIGVIGSTSFLHPDSEDGCRQTGRALSRETCVLVTGGLAGIPRTVTAGFGRPNDTCHLLPRCWPRPPAGHTIRTGWTMRHRRRVLSRACPLYICVEGGRGTAHEARLVLARQGGVIPIGRFGGYARQLHSGLPCPGWAEQSDWKTIAARESDLDVVAFAVARLVRQFASEHDARHRLAEEQMETPIDGPILTTSQCWLVSRAARMCCPSRL